MTTFPSTSPTPATQIVVVRPPSPCVRLRTEATDLTENQGTEGRGEGESKPHPRRPKNSPPGTLGSPSSLTGGSNCTRTDVDGGPPALLKCRMVQGVQVVRTPLLSLRPRRLRPPRPRWVGSGLDPCRGPSLRQVLSTRTHRGPTGIGEGHSTESVQTETKGS